MTEMNNKYFDARVAVVMCAMRVLKVQLEISDRDDLDVDFHELDWRFDELYCVFNSGDPSLMFSAVKLADRHLGEIEDKL